MERRWGAWGFPWLTGAGRPPVVPSGSFNPLNTGTAAAPQTGERAADCSSVRSTASAHPGVLNIVMGDASTKSVSKTIDPTLWWQLIRVADGEIIADF